MENRCLAFERPCASSAICDYGTPCGFFEALIAPCVGEPGVNVGNGGAFAAANGFFPGVGHLDD